LYAKIGAIALETPTMLTLDFHPTGRHFLQIPGPSPVPDRILRAMSLPTIDHRGPEFAALGLRMVKFKTLEGTDVYFAAFEVAAPRPAPEAIKPCGPKA